VNPRLRILLTAALLLVGASLLLGLLNHAKFSSTFENRSRDREAITARDAAQALEAHLALGLSLSDSPALRGLLERVRAQDPLILAVTVLNERGGPAVASGRSQPALRDSMLATAARDGVHYARSGELAVLGIELANAFDVRAGWIVIEYSLAGARQSTADAFSSLWPAGLAACGVALLFLVILGWKMAARAASGDEGANRPLTLLVTGLLVAIQLVFAWGSYSALSRINSQDSPELAATLARTLEPTLERALGNGIALTELRGVEAWLAGALSAGPEFAGLSLLDASGKTLFQSAVPERSAGLIREYDLPIRQAGVVTGSIRVQLDAGAMQERGRQLVIEFLIILMAGALLINEILKVVTTPAPKRNEPTLGALRLPLFLFFLGSELPRSFLPSWSRDLAERAQAGTGQGDLFEVFVSPLVSLPPTVLASVPISLFLLSVALSSPIAGRYCAKWGPRRLFVAGIGLALAGHLLAMFADSLAMLVLARIVAGASFGAVSLAAFDYIGRITTSRAVGMAIYLTALVSAGVAGAGIGALIVDRAGIAFVFAFGMLCSVLGWLSLVRFPHLALREQLKRPLLASLGKLLATPRFLRLVVLVAMPLQIVQQGLIFYWVPLALQGLGERTSLVGLAMMGHFLMVLLLNAPLARMADRNNSHDRLIAGGVGIAGLTALAAGTVFGPVAIVAGVVLTGIGWALAFPSAGAVALRLSQNELSSVDPAVTIGVYRSIDRVCAMLAPLVVGSLIFVFDFHRSALILAAILLACALMQWLFSGSKNK
jgi:predicted MFS family arabinose efflux permease